MNYMRALQQRFAVEPECLELKAEMEDLCHGMRKLLGKGNRRYLLRLLDLEQELQDEIALANFLSGFKLAWGISQELIATGQYSFIDEEEKQACEAFNGKDE